MEERYPPLKVRHWSVRTGDLTLDQRGLLITVLDWSWTVQRELPDDVMSLSCELGIDKRKIGRLWTPEVQAAFNKLRRERRPIDGVVRSRVWKKTNGHCWHCKCELTHEPHQANSFHVDHLKSVRSGGMSSDKNLVPSCMRCNLEKGAANA